MAQTAKVAKVLGARQWEWSHWVMWAIKLEMDNGDVGEINKKNEMAFKTGDELTYDVEKNEKFGDKFKEAKKPYEWGSKWGYSSEPFEDKIIPMSISYAKDLVVAGMNTGVKVELEETADRMYTWMVNKRSISQITKWE